MGRLGNLAKSATIAVIGVAIASSVSLTTPPTVSAAPGDGFVEVQVARLLDTRPGSTTVDGRFAGGGEVDAGRQIAFDVGGRAGVPVDVAAVAVTVTVTEPTADGFVTLSACGVMPTTSTVNYRAGQTVANSAITGLSADGRLCVYAMARTHVVVDVTGAFDSGFVPVANARLLDTRPSEPTSDGRFAGAGLVQAQGVIEVQVAGRAGVPSGAEAAALTITTTESTGPGYVSAYPCGPRPLASTLNHALGENRANSLVVPLDASGKLCLFTLASTHLVVDVSGYVPSGSPYTPIGPARLVDTRVDGATADSRCTATGRLRGLTALDLQVAGRAGVPATGVGAVAVNVVALGERRPGFVTMSEGDGPVPLSSNGNFGSGEMVATSAIVPMGADGSISLFVNTGIHVVVDVVGWLPGTSTAAVALDCSGSFVRPTGDIDSVDGSCAVRQDGTVVCWNVTAYSGGIIFGAPMTIAGIDDAVEVNDQCARRRTGVVTCFTYGPPPPWDLGLTFTRPAVDLSARCVITSDRRVECARASDGVAVEVALPAAPSHFLSEPDHYSTAAGAIRRVRNVDGTVTEITGADTFTARLLGDFAPGVSWSSVVAPASGDCAVLTGDRVGCADDAVRTAPDAIQIGRHFLLHGDGSLEVERFDWPSMSFGMARLLPNDELVYAEVLMTHWFQSPLICTLSTAAVLRCARGADPTDPAAFTIEGVLMPE